MSLSNLQNNVNRENELWALHLSISVLDQPMVKLDSLDEVLNRDPLVEPMEPFCVIFGYEGWGEPGNKFGGRRRIFATCISCQPDAGSAWCLYWQWGCQERYDLPGTPDLLSQERFKARDLKGGVCNDLKGHDVVAIGGDRRRVKAVLAFGYLYSAVIDHLPGLDPRSLWHKTKTGPIMLHNIFHRLCRMNPVVDDRLCQKSRLSTRRWRRMITSAELGITFSLKPALNMVTAVVVLWIASVS